MVTDYGRCISWHLYKAVVPILFLEIYLSAKFSSYPDQTYQNQKISLRSSKAIDNYMCDWTGLELGWKWTLKLICGDRRNLQKDKQHCNTPRSELYGDVARLNPLHTRKHTWNLQKKKKKTPKGHSDWEKQGSLVWWASIPSFMIKGKPGTAHHLQSSIPVLVHCKQKIK